jgi:hypothetical protein
VAPDDQLNGHLERILASLRGQLDGGLRAAAEELVRATSAERDRAVLEATTAVRREADDQVEQARDAARTESDELRAAADVKLTELRNMLDEARAHAQQQIDASRQALETEVAATRATAAAEVEGVRREAQARIDELHRQADERVGTLDRDLAAIRAELAVARSAEAARHRAHPSADDAHGVSAVAVALRSLDESRSLSAVLEQVVQFASRSAGRCALLLVKGDRLHMWRAAGFERGPSSAVPMPEAGLVGAAVRERRAVLRRQGEGPPLPAFAAGQERDAAALPLTVADVVVAVLYGDASPGGADPAWTASLEVVTRHASRVLETATVQQATGIHIGAPMARTSQPHPGHQPPGGVS